MNASEKPFFLRDPWVYDPKLKPARVRMHDLGFDTRALHAGFHPLKNVEQFRAFVPPIVQSMTYPYESFDQFPGLYLRAQQNPHRQRAGRAPGCPGRR